jgi:hypothetical protein
LAGYEDLNDAERVAADPTFRVIGSKKNWDRGAALTSRLQSFETGMLADDENLIGLMAVNRELVAQAEGRENQTALCSIWTPPRAPSTGNRKAAPRSLRVGLLSPAAAVHHGDCLGAKLRPGNVSSAEDWEELLLPEIERQQAEGNSVTFRADAAFAKPEIYEALEERGVQYAIRIPANKSLELEIEDILFRPPGRPSPKPLVRYKSFRYRAASWSTSRRLVAAGGGARVGATSGGSHA